jgi:large subunit ribosomal protein L15
MNLSNLQPAGQHTVKRLGRGEGSGKGGTSSRGHNGQNLVLVILKDWF